MYIGYLMFKTEQEGLFAGMLLLSPEISYAEYLCGIENFN